MYRARSHARVDETRASWAISTSRKTTDFHKLFLRLQRRCRTEYETLFHPFSLCVTSYCVSWPNQIYFPGLYAADTYLVTYKHLRSEALYFVRVNNVLRTFDFILLPLLYIISCRECFLFCFPAFALYYYKLICSFILDIYRIFSHDKFFPCNSFICAEFLHNFSLLQPDTILYRKTTHIENCTYPDDPARMLNDSKYFIIRSIALADTVNSYLYFNRQRAIGGQGQRGVKKKEGPLRRDLCTRHNAAVDRSAARRYYFRDAYIAASALPRMINIVVGAPSLS